MLYRSINASYYYHVWEERAKDSLIVFKGDGVDVMEEKKTSSPIPLLPKSEDYTEFHPGDLNATPRKSACVKSQLANNLQDSV